MRAGKLRTPNDYSQKLLLFLRTHGEFTRRQMAEETGVTPHFVTVYLSRNVARGNLERIMGEKGKPFLYRVKSLPRLQKSKGDAAQAVWDILIRASTPLSKKEIWNKANRGRTQENPLSREDVERVVSRLFREGVLVREVLSRKNRTFQLVREIKVRPAIPATPHAYVED